MDPIANITKNLESLSTCKLFAQHHNGDKRGIQRRGNTLHNTSNVIRAIRTVSRPIHSYKGLKKQRLLKDQNTALHSTVKRVCKKKAKHIPNMLFFIQSQGRYKFLDISGGRPTFRCTTSLRDLAAQIGCQDTLVLGAPIPRMPTK